MVFQRTGRCGIFTGMNRTKLFLAALAVVCGGGAWAQPTLVDPVDVVEGTLSDPQFDEVSVHWDVLNGTGEDLTLMVTRTLVQAVSPYNQPYVATAPGAYDRFCWGPLCYNFGTAASSTNASLLVTIAPGLANTTFVADYYHNDVAGMTAIEYCFHPVGAPEAGACHVVSYCMDAENCVLGTGADLVAQGPRIAGVSPQPLVGVGALQYDLAGAGKGRLRLVASSGMEVAAWDLEADRGSLFLSSDRLAPGLYIAVLEVDGLARHTTRCWVGQ